MTELYNVKRASRRLSVLQGEHKKLTIRYVDDGHEDEPHDFVVHQDDVADLEIALSLATAPSGPEQDAYRAKRRETAVLVGEHGDWIDENDGSAFIAVDSENMLIEATVGPVFRGNDPGKAPGLWISFQDPAWAGPLKGPFLMSRAVFDELVKHVDKLSKEWAAMLDAKPEP